MRRREAGRAEPSTLARGPDARQRGAPPAVATMRGMQELLAPARVTRDEAFARCDRHLRSRWRSWRLVRLGVAAERRGELGALVAWHALAREASPPRRDTLSRELEDVLDEGRDGPETPLGVALAAAVRRFSLPPNLLRGTLVALADDERRRTFTTRRDLLAHARRLATAEGRLYLGVLERHAEREAVLSDSLCLGLQLARWTVALRTELERGRLRAPAEELARFDVSAAELLEAPDVPAVRRLVASESAWAREHLARGWPLCDALGRRTGRALAFVLRWNAASLSALEARGFALAGRAPRGGLLRGVACSAAALLARPPRLG